jgi:tripartite-type tricarboxylate transporter receptor subunit TctC
MIVTRSLRFLICAFCLFATFPVPAGAAWPERAITLVHGFGGGGNIDTISRIVAERLSVRLGQSIVVEARAGAGGRIAAAQVARSEADGYTLIVLPGGHAVTAAMHEKLAYDTLEDFSFISLMTQVPLILVTYPDHPLRSVADLIKTQKASSGPMFYGSAGPGTTQHLAGALFAAMARVDLQHVSTKGGAVVSTMLLGKHIDFAFESPILVLELAMGGQLRALATTGPKRFFALPDVPTVGEMIPGYEATSWLGVAGPPKLPPDIVKRLNGEIAAVMEEPEVVEKLRVLGTLPLASTPEGFKQRVAADVAKWSKVVADTGIKRLGSGQ